jgi:hypothetical protein
MSEPTPDKVDLDLDEEKLEKWDEVKSDYEVNPDGKPMPNVWDAGEGGANESEDRPEADAEQREQVNDEDAPEVVATDTDADARDADARADEETS